MASGTRSRAQVLHGVDGVVDALNTKGSRAASGPMSGGAVREKNPATSAFDPSRPVGIHNLPPREQLRFTDLHHNNAFLVAYDSTPVGIYKWRENEKYTENEAHAYDASLLLGLSVVPPTRTFVGPLGKGSFQEYVLNRGGSHDTRSPAGQEVGAFDYIMAHADRTSDNALALVRPRGKIAATDNELIMQERVPVGNGNILVSGFVADNVNQPLDASLLGTLGKVDPEAFSRGLQAMGYSRDGADWSAERLVEIQREGMITGAAWGGPIIRTGERPIYLSAQGRVL
ncbi:hypothetical protein [Nocardia jinanensis]|uniref:Uncharacterized protein n=1 Tax=Nocardia jinanensis TaxID=382504 RepID=A0A917VRI5_9NOCA|nr:hypothetical protein [Nocardia jinanensis]GGL10640.1 hypothetical protein GCM10011588_26400 [Nocardia jinanensis]